jgi:hypothetical protein
MRVFSVLATLAAVLVVVLVGCASPPIEAVSDFDRQFDFSGLKKIAIQPIDRTQINTVRVSDMQVDRINAAIVDELQRKGYQLVDSNIEADLLLTWHLVTDERVDVRSYNNMSYYNCWMCGPAVSDVSVHQYTQGTFIVDLIDPTRNQSVWRSTIESRLESNPGPEASAARRLEAAKAIFANFPPR